MTRFENRRERHLKSSFITQIVQKVKAIFEIGKYILEFLLRISGPLTPMLFVYVDPLNDC